MNKDIGMLAAVACAAGLDKDKAETLEVSAAFIKQHFGAVAAELIGEGAKAEQARITGIEAFAGLGHDKIIAEHKADPSKTALDTGFAFAAAQRATLAKQVANLEEDEGKVKGIRSETANSSAAEKPAGYGLVGEPKWTAEFGSSQDLQAEFSTEARYLAFKKAEAAGTVKILRNKIDNR